MYRLYILFQFVTFHLKEDLASVIFHITSSTPHQRSVKSLFMEAVKEMEIISKPWRAARISVSVSEEQCLVRCGTQWNSFFHRKAKNAINQSCDRWKALENQVKPSHVTFDLLSLIGQRSMRGLIGWSATTMTLWSLWLVSYLSFVFCRPGM